MAALVPALTADAVSPPATLGRRLEEGLLAVALATLIVLPLLEMVLRSGFETGVPGSSTLVQHLTLVISMAGSLLATRDNRLISFSTLPTLLRGVWLQRVRAISQTAAVVVAGALALAGAQFVAVEREAARTFLFDLPLWIVELVLPVGFAAMTLRLAYHGAASWLGRAGVLAAAARSSNNCIEP